MLGSTYSPQIVAVDCLLVIAGDEIQGNFNLHNQSALAQTVDSEVGYTTILIPISMKVLLNSANAQN